MMQITDSQRSELARELVEQQARHSELNKVIDLLTISGVAEQMNVRLMKKQRLLLKDRVARLQSRLIPDLDA